MFTTLIDCEQLAAHLDDPEWVVVDCRFDLLRPEAGRAAYAEAHIAGAQYAHLEEDLSSPITPQSGRHPLPVAQELASKLEQWGVGHGSQVVVYDAAGGAIAARLWWLLRWMGHAAVAVLDGGFPAWSRGSYPIANLASPRAPAMFMASAEAGLWVDTAYVEREIVYGRRMLLIDARAAVRFRGEHEPVDVIAGHVPGAVNMPYAANMDEQGHFLSADRLRDRFATVLLRMPPSRVVCMCGSGVTACHTLLAMEVAGLPGAKLYPGSWSEWIRDELRPAERT